MRPRREHEQAEARKGWPSLRASVPIAFVPSTHICGYPACTSENKKCEFEPIFQVDLMICETLSPLATHYSSLTTTFCVPPRRHHYEKMYFAKRTGLRPRL